MKLTLFKLMVVLTMGLFCFHCAVWAITADKVNEIVRTSDILAPAYRKQAAAAVQGDVVAVSVFRNPKANEEDCKIDSILLGKKIMDADAAINRVRLSFYDGSEQGMFWAVEVSRSDVKAYAAATVNKDVLLGSISLTKQSQTLNLDQLLSQGVKKGPLLDERSNLMAHMRYLKKKRLVGLDKYLPEFQGIEHQAECGMENQLEERIVALDLKLQEETKHFNQSRQAEHAHQVAQQQAGGGFGDPGSQRVWQALSPKYPQFVPSAGGSQRERRMRLSLRLMMLADQGQLGTADLFARQFAAIEKLAATGDSALDMRLRSVEMSVGLPLFPGGGRGQ